MRNWDEIGKPASRDLDMSDVEADALRDPNRIESYEHNIDEHIVKVTRGPVEGMQEIVLLLDGHGWSITEMIVGPQDAHVTRIVLSK